MPPHTLMLKILIVEGNVKAMRDKAHSEGALTQSELYQKTLDFLADDLSCSVAYPGDEDAALPDTVALKSYDGIAWTGSSLNIYDRSEPILRQIEFMTRCLQLPTKIFGSCWGLQVAAVAAGGEVGANSKGREIGLARQIRLTSDGLDHPMYAGKAPEFDAVAIHIDHVVRLPDQARILSSNAMSQVQAAELCHGPSVFWGVQYHPEFDLEYISVLIRRYAESLVEEGICSSQAEAERWARNLVSAQNEEGQEALREEYGLHSDVLNPHERLRELFNWLAFLRSHQ